MCVRKDIMDHFTNHFKITPAPNLCVYKQTLLEKYMLHFIFYSMGEIGHQHIQTLLAAATQHTSE